MKAAVLAGLVSDNLQINQKRFSEKLVTKKFPINR